MGIEYDLLRWVSWPSSLRIINPERECLRYSYQNVEVTPGKRLHVEVMGKKGTSPMGACISINWWDGERWVDLVPDKGIPGRIFPEGVFDWTLFDFYYVDVPQGTRLIRVQPVGGGGSAEKPSVTWFDDLKIYQEGIEKPIYKNYFSNWNPYLGAGVGSVVGGLAGRSIRPEKPLTMVAGAGLGALSGTLIGILLTR